ncbi:hypothetical protein P692DRAFT_201806556 [Suillus brevipes Sb2]|nr:hypothetical protein P692DRAFT_201806556 [Suillus brevipes Sb2]
MAGILHKTYTIGDGRVDFGDIWQVVGGRLLEAQREESLQSFAGDTARRCTAERTFMEDRRDRSLRPIEVPTVDHASISTTRRCVVTPPIAHSADSAAYLAATQQKCESWLRRQNADLTPPSKPFPVESDPPPNAAAVAQLAYPPEQRTSVIVHCNQSFRLCTTWVALRAQEALNEARKVELNTQAELMATYLDIERYHSHHRNVKSELLYLRAKMLRAKAEVEVFTLAIENASSPRPTFFQTVLRDQVQTCKERIPAGSINDRTESTRGANIFYIMIRLRELLTLEYNPKVKGRRCWFSRSLAKRLLFFYVAGLLDRSFGIWPTQLPRYAEPVILTNGREDYSVPTRRIDDPALVTFAPTSNDVSLTVLIRPGLYGSNWVELVHPLGGTYYYHNKKNTYTSLNIRHIDRRGLEDFIEVSRAAAKEDEWVLVVHQMSYRGEEVYQYYYVVHDLRIITWLEDLDGYLLFRECIQASEWRHKRLELEAQYWRHVEFFPHKFHMTRSQVRRIRREILCYLGDQMKQVDAQLASVELRDDREAEALAENEIIEDTGVVLCCRILYMLRHFQYLNRHNQPEARLIRGHAVIEKRRTCKALYFMGNTAATILCMPITIDRIRNTSVDGIVNGVDVKTFIDDFSNQAKSQITLAGVSVAMDVAILAIPGLGTTVYYLQRKTMMLIVITSIPTCFCVLRNATSVMSSILGFLAGVAADFKPSTPLMIACITTLGVVICSLLVLTRMEHGVGLAVELCRQKARPTKYAQRLRISGDAGGWCGGARQNYEERPVGANIMLSLQPTIAKFSLDSSVQPVTMMVETCLYL